MTQLFISFASLRTRLFQSPRPFLPPKRACILLPTGFRNIMAVGPLLKALTEAFPQSRFDWVISDLYRPLVASSPYLHRIIPAAPILNEQVTLSHLQGLAARLRPIRFDTCFIPSPSPLLSYTAYRAEIPQRIGLDIDRSSVALTTRVSTNRETSLIEANQALGQALGLTVEQKQPIFHPSDSDRDKITELLIDEIGWDATQRIVVLQPGGSLNFKSIPEQKRWPLERFVLLGNDLIRRENILVILVGTDEDRALARSVSGLIFGEVHDFSGRLSIGEIGALCQISTLFIGNESDQIYLASGVNCPTIGVLGSDPRPATRFGFEAENNMHFIYREYSGDFDWSKGVMLEEVVETINKLLD